MSCDLLIPYFLYPVSVIHPSSQALLTFLQDLTPRQLYHVYTAQFQDPQRHIWGALVMVAGGIHDLCLIGDKIRYEQLLFFTQSVTVMKICLDALIRMCYCQACKQHLSIKFLPSVALTVLEIGSCSLTSNRRSNYQPHFQLKGNWKSTCSTVRGSKYHLR